MLTFEKGIWGRGSKLHGYYWCPELSRYVNGGAVKDYRRQERNGAKEPLLRGMTQADKNKIKSATAARVRVEPQKAPPHPEADPFRLADDVGDIFDLEEALAKEFKEYA